MLVVTLLTQGEVVSDNLICCPHYKWMGQWMNKVIEINNVV